MIRLLPSVPRAIYQFRANPWPYQKTLVTPRKDLASFLSACWPRSQLIMGSHRRIRSCSNLTISWNSLKARELSIENYWTFCAEASNKKDVAVLLDAVLNDWIDFVFVPSPTSFAVYADHDEFLTIYVPTSSGLDQVVARLELVGFVFQDYVRPSAGDIWR